MMYLWGVHAQSLVCILYGLVRVVKLKTYETQVVTLQLLVYCIFGYHSDLIG